MTVALLGLVGVTLIIVRGTLFVFLQRRWPKFFGCCQCVGMWVGAAGGALELVVPGHGRSLDALIVGGATSFLAMLADAILLQLLGDPENGEKS